LPGVSLAWGLWADDVGMAGDLAQSDRARIARAGIAALPVERGTIGAFVLPKLIDQPVSLSTLAVTAAIGVSLAIGIGFGVYPASRAARLTPIDALRSE
jgi:ABC-type lipoprotein release transport system permease subunit